MTQHVVHVVQHLGKRQMTVQHVVHVVQHLGK